jgi:hypothetical protein
MIDKDLKRLITLFDIALKSNNDTVKRALQNMLTVTMLAQVDNDTTQGPLESLLTDLYAQNKIQNVDIVNLRNDIDALKREMLAVKAELGNIYTQRTKNDIPPANGYSANIPGYGVINVNTYDSFDYGTLTNDAGQIKLFNS